MRTAPSAWLGRHLLGARVPVVLAIGAVTAVAALFARDVVPDFTFWRLLGTSHGGALRQLEAFNERFSSSVAFNYVVLVDAGDDVLSEPALATIDRLTHDLEDLDGIRRVQSLTTIDDITSQDGDVEIAPLIDGLPLSDAEREHVRERIRTNPLIGGTLVADDMGLTVVVAEIDSDLERIEDRTPVVEAIRALVARTAAGSGLELRGTGLAELEQIMLELGQSTQRRMTGVSMVMVSVLLFVFYRSGWAVLFPGVSLGVVIVWTVGLMGATGGHLNILTIVIPSLIVIIGMADALHLISRYHEELRHGRDREDALRHTVEHLASACLVTSVTTAIGFGSMVTSELVSLQRFGLYTAAGVLLAYVVTVALTPILLSFVPVPRTAVARRERHDTWDHALTWIAHFTTRRPWSISAFFTVATIAAVLVATRVHVETAAMQELDDDHPVVVATRLAERRLQGVLGFEIDLETEPGAALEPDFLRHMREVQDLLEEDPMVSGTFSVVDVLEQMNRALHDDDPAMAVVPETRGLAAQLLLLYSFSGDPEDVDRLITTDHGHTHISARLRDLGSTYFFPMLDRIRPEVESRFVGPDVRATFTGESYVANEGLRKIVRSLLSSLALAFVCILATMALLFRSFRVGLLSMVPNVLPAVGTLATMVLIDTPLRMSTSMICAVALGIAVDDTIHVLVRLRAELLEEASDRAAAIRRALLGTGRPVVFSSLGLMGGFALMVFSDFRAWRDFGILGSVAIGSALVADLFFTPAVIYLFHPRSAEVADDPEPSAPLADAQR